MAISYTNVDICNLALGLVSPRPVLITSLSDSSREAAVCNSYLTRAISATAREVDWPHTRAMANLTVAVNYTCPAPYTTAFDLPADFLRLVAVWPVSTMPWTRARIPFAVVGAANTSTKNDKNVLLWGGSDTSIQCVYMRLDTTFATAPPVYIDLVAWRMALLIATELGAVPQVLHSTAEGYEAALSHARMLASTLMFPLLPDELTEEAVPAPGFGVRSPSIMQDKRQSSRRNDAEGGD